MHMSCSCMCCCSCSFASKPASRQYVSEIFHLLKSNDNDTLSREEFAVVMKILYSQVFTRIVIQWTLTLISERCLDVFVFDTFQVCHQLKCMCSNLIAT